MSGSDSVLAHVHAGDVRQAQALVQKACSTASDAWIPNDAIADALLLELARRVEHQQSKERLLRLVQAMLQEPSDQSKSALF